MAYGKYIFSLITIAGLIYLSGPKVQAHRTLSAVEYDSVELSQDSIYICHEHYFEWCREPAVCPYCGEPLELEDLWTYYKLLECEDCQKFFDDHLEQFRSE